MKIHIVITGTLLSLALEGASKSRAGLAPPLKALEEEPPVILRRCFSGCSDFGLLMLGRIWKGEVLVVFQDLECWLLIL